MFRIVLSTIILLIALELSFSINPIQTIRNVYRESMCVLIDTEGIYDIKSIENSNVTFSNLSIEILEKGARNMRRFNSKFNENFIKRSDLHHNFYEFFEFKEMEKAYNLLHQSIFDQYVMESKRNIEFDYYNHTSNQSVLAIAFYNLRNGTSLGLTSFNTSKISIGYTSVGIKIQVTNYQNNTWSSTLPGYVMLYLSVSRNLDLTIHDMGSAIILSKECLDICTVPKRPYRNFQRNLVLYESNGSYEINQILRHFLSSSSHDTYELQRELTSEKRHDLMVVYTASEPGNEELFTDMNWLTEVYQSPWYYLKFPGYSIQNLVSLCNDMDSRDCYKTNLKQTFSKETLISFMILQENKNGKMYLFEKYEDKTLVLSQLKFPQIKFIHASVFNESIDEYYNNINQINIVLKDCKKNRHILQAFDPLPIAIHQNSICIVEESGKYKIVCDAEELTQIVDIEVSEINLTGGIPYRELRSNLFGHLIPITDLIRTNYSIFKPEDIYTFIHIGLGAYNENIYISQDRIININFESLANWRGGTVIEFSTMDIHTANLEILNFKISFPKSKATIEISNSTITIRRFSLGFEVDNYKYEDKILYHISYVTDDVYAEPNISDKYYNLVAKTTCH